MKLIKSLLAAVSACAIGLNSIAALLCTEAAAMELEGVTENTALYKSCGKLTAGTVELTLDELKAANYTVTVPITVSGTSRWRDLGFGVSYSTSDLTCTKVSNGSAIVYSGYTVHQGGGINKEKGIVWCGYSVAQNSEVYDFVSDGEAAVLTFTVASDAAHGDSYQIKLLAENNGIPQEIVTADGTGSSFLEDGAIIIKGSATTTSRATTTTTRATTTMTTTEPTLTTTTTTTTSATTTTTTTTTIGIYEVIAASSAIECAALEPNFYFCRDDREFDVFDLYESIVLISYDVYGNEISREDIKDKCTFGGLTPELLFADGTNNTAEYDGVYRGYISPTYNGVGIDEKSLVYIGVKGDADLNGEVNVADASTVLNYYAFSGAWFSASFTYDPTSDYEILSYFLADVDTESTAGKDSNAGKIQVADASNILTYYALDGACMDPRWQDIIPSLVDIPNSLWEYKAGR